MNTTERGKPATFCRYYASESVACMWMRIMNEAHARGDGQQFCVVPPGPETEGFYALMDLDTVLERGLPHTYRRPEE